MYTQDSLANHIAFSYDLPLTDEYFPGYRQLSPASEPGRME
jgi:hypothetical protein